MNNHQIPIARFGFLDSARGIAMGLVCLSHFVLIYGQTSHISFDLIYPFTKLATPTFMLVSGTLLGLFSVIKRQKFNQVRNSYVNRGIFLLTFGHLLISLNHVLLARGAYESLKYVFVTDAIGFNCIIGPIFIRRFGPMTRIALGIFFILASWSIVIYWTPTTACIGLIKEVFFGDSGDRSFHVLHYTFPVIPWCSFFLISTVVGEQAGHLWLKGAARWTQIFMKVGIACIGLSIITKFVFIFCKIIHWINPNNLTPELCTETAVKVI